MKKLFSIVLILFSATGIAQNVGVGETAPTEMRLQVKRADSAVLLLQNSTTTGTDNKTGLFYKTGNYYSGSIATIGSGATFRMGLFTYGALSPSGLIERISILDGGNIGIGTTTPSAKLEVNGLLKLTGGSPGAGKFLISDNTGLASWYDLNPNLVPAGVAGNTLRNNGSGWLATSNLYNDGSKIGIGTTTPGSMLEIKSTAFNTADLELNASLGDNAVLRLNKNGSYNYSTIRFKTSGSVNWDLGMQGSDNFKLQYTPTNATIMDVNVSNRNIGFLTNDFSESVNIGGSLGVFGASITKGSNAGFQFQDRTANAYGGWNWYADAGKANLFRYGLGNTLTIDASGYLGIGTATPGYRLDVNGRMRMRHNGLTSGIWFNNSTNVESSFIGQYTDNLFGIFGNAWQFAINRNDGTVYMGSGNLDGENLTNGAGYKLRVFGKVIAEEVRVQLKNAWPDYVFENGYKKLSLSELEKYVIENKHLPNIPSAKEIEKDGHQLGDVQIKMLEKIEELSLYIIDQNKAIEELKKRINQIEKN